MIDSSLTFTMDLASDLYNSQDDYPVSFNDAWAWLGYSRKDSAKESFLNCGFIEEEDYSRLIWNNKKRGKPSEVMTLTVDCFKTWGMMAQTKQGKLIRRYHSTARRLPL